MIVAFTIALLSALMVGTFGISHSRAERARNRAQLIADFEEALTQARAVSSPAVDTNVVSLEAFRMRRLTSSHAHRALQSQRAAR